VTSTGDLPGRDDLPALVRAAASVIHGPERVERKLAWLCAAVVEASDATWSAYVQYADGRGSVRATNGVAPTDIEGVAGVVVSRLLRSALAGTPVLHLPDARRMGLGPSTAGEVIVVPVLAARGELYGGLLIGLGPDPDGTADARATEIGLAFAAHVGVAFDNHETMRRLAELEAVQREVVDQLQEAVRPPTPVVDATELGVHYLAADPHAPTGGDLYDWQVLPDGDLHLVVVDVLGKGVGATKDALAVTHTLRILVLDGCPIDRLVERADELLLAQSPELVATLMIGRYRPTTGDLVLAGGGHPPALVIRRGGAVEEVSAPGIPIGWPGAGSTSVTKLTLDRSDTLLLYTDGLIEATKNVVEGLANLVTAAHQTATYPAPQLARALVDRTLAGANRRDDTLALVLRRRTAPAAEDEHRLGPFRYRFSPSAAAVPLARHLLGDWLSRQPLDPDAIGDLLLVASELCANAVRAATRQPGAVVLRAWTEGDAVFLETEDEGGSAAEFPDPGSGPTVPDPDAEAGRGLYLVRALTDDVSVEIEGTRTTVRCLKRAVVAATRE